MRAEFFYILKEEDLDSCRDGSAQLSPGLAWMNYRIYLSALLPVPAQSDLQLSPGSVAHPL